MCTPRGMGYLTRLDSSAYSNETRDRGVLLDTTSKGMPIGPPSQVPEPKSACTGAFKPIEAISWAEFAATGSLSTRWFHGLFAGKTGQRGAAGSRSARAVEPASRATARAAATARVLLMALSSAAEWPRLSHTESDDDSAAAGGAGR